MSKLGVTVKWRKIHHLALVPEYAKPGDSGADVRWYEEVDGVNLWPGETRIFWSGIAVELPDCWELQVRGRSGLSSKGILCALGTVDSQFRGQIGVTLTNTTGEPYLIRRGDRIAQLVIGPVFRASFSESDELSSSERGIGGFGSTGR